jgi:membrane-bound lytic murein transglycosylase A
MRLGVFAVLAAAGLLTACASTEPLGPAATYAPPPGAAPPPAPAPTVPSAQLTRVADLPGWDEEDHLAALRALQAGCGVARDAAMQAVCARARRLGAVDESAARGFLEANFVVAQVVDGGLLTAYFAPEYEARAHSEGDFTAPVRPRPGDLVVIDLGLFDPALSGRSITGKLAQGRLLPYDDRAAIEQSPADEALAWMRPEDLFFMQIQGGGVLDLPGGRRLRAVFSASNGRAFVGVANVLRDQGLADTSGDSIRAWLADHRGAEADAVMRRNPRYVFFSLSPDDGRDPPGAAGISLPPGRALAVDPARHRLGGVYWIDARAPTLNGAVPTYRRLALALDTGGAIKGDVRADLYLGRGARAGAEAGRVRHALRLYALEPVGDEVGGLLDSLAREDAARKASRTAAAP